MTRGIVVAFVLGVLVTGAPGIWAMQATSQPQPSPITEATPVEPAGLVFAPDEEVHGATLGEWSARYWQWISSLPASVNPSFDPSGEQCGYGQQGPVFFIPRSMPACTVPADVAIFIPLAGSACSTIEPPPFHGSDEASLQECAALTADRYTNITVQIDGQYVPEVDSYQARSPLFPLNLPENNILAAPHRMGYAVADGYQLILRPLSPGIHEIVIHIEVTEGYALPDKTLVLTVIEPYRDD